VSRGCCLAYSLAYRLTDRTFCSHCDWLNICYVTGDMALLVDTSHPMIRPEVEAGLEEARRVLQDGGKFCLQVIFIYSKILTL
jgi:hypothetical protein